MASFNVQTYTPKYIPMNYLSIVSIGAQHNPNPELQREKTSYTVNKMNQQSIKSTNKLQVSSEIKADARQNTRNQKSKERKPRVSAYQFYKTSEQFEHSIETSQTPKTAQKQFTQPFDGLNTKYFLTTTLTKKANSDRQAAKGSKINQTINQKLVSNNEAKLGDKPIMFEKARKGSMNYPISQVVESQDPFEHPNLKRFKSPMASTLKEEFRKVMMDTCDSELYDRKTEKSVKSNVDQEKVIMTRKELEIMKLKQTLAEMEKTIAEQKLIAYEKEKQMGVTTQQMEKEIRELKQENTRLKSTQQIMLHQKNKELQLNYDQKCKQVKQLKNDNTLLVQNLLNYQSIYSNMKAETTQQKNLLVSELNRLKQNNSPPNHKNLSYDRYSSYFLHKKSIADPYNPHHPSSKDEEIEDLKKQSAIKEEYIRMLHMKEELMEKSIFELKLASSRLKMTEKVLSENNQTIFKHCLRSLNEELQEEGQQ